MKATRTILAVALAAAVAAGGVAFATEESATEVIVACVSDQGLVRIVAAETNCRRNERLVSWNRQGHAGPAGPAGPAGQPGPQGVAGPSGVTDPASRWYADRDSDGHGDWYDRVDSAVQPPGYVANNTDCNDDNADVSPSSGNNAGIGWDYDCDGAAAEALGWWYPDADGDGWGTEIGKVRGVASPPANTVRNPHDCDDSDAGVTGECRGTDFYYYLDSEGNIAYGEAGALEKPGTDRDGDGHKIVGGPGMAGGGDDCNDLQPSVYPGNLEVRYDGLDNDCNSSSPDVETFVPDAGRHDPVNWGWRNP